MTVQNTAGDRLENGLNISFVTPESNDELVLFVDTVAGPPQVVIRGLNGEPLTSEDFFVEFPGRAAGTDREFIEFDVALQQGVINSNVPLNLYSSDVTQQFGFVLQFNQPIIRASSNVNSSRIGIEFLNQATSTWEPVPSSVELLSNCTDNGSSVRLTPTASSRRAPAPRSGPRGLPRPDRRSGALDACELRSRHHRRREPRREPRRRHGPDLHRLHRAGRGRRILRGQPHPRVQPARELERLGRPGILASSTSPGPAAPAVTSTG